MQHANVERTVREIVGDHALSSSVDRDQELDRALDAVGVETLSRETLLKLLRYVSKLNVRPDLVLSLARKLCLHPNVIQGENLGVVLDGPLLQPFNPALASVPIRPKPVTDIKTAIKLAADGDFWTLYDVCATASPAFAQRLADEFQKLYPTPVTIFLIEKLRSGSHPIQPQAENKEEPLKMFASLDLREVQSLATFDNPQHPDTTVESGLYPASPRITFETGLYPVSETTFENGLYPVSAATPANSDNGLHLTSRLSPYDPTLGPLPGPLIPVESYMHSNQSSESFSKSRLFRKDKSPKTARITVDLPGEKSIALSPDCKHALAWNQWQIVLVETNGKLYSPTPVSNVVMATMSDNCVALIRRTTEDEIICYRLRNLAEKKPPFLRLRRSPISCLCLSPNGSWLAVGYNGFVEVHSFASITQLRTYQVTGRCTGLSFSSKELLICTRTGNMSHISGCPPPYTTLYPLASIDAEGTALRISKNIFLEKHLIDPAGNATSTDLGPIYMALTDEKILVIILLDGTIHRFGRGTLTSVPRLYSRYQQFGATQTMDAKIKDGHVTLAMMGNFAMDITHVALDTK